MAALTAERNTPRLGHAPGITLNIPAKAATTVYKGGLVMIDAGYAAPGSTATGKIAAGRAAASVDNSAGAAGDLDVPVEPGVFRFGNSASSDAIAQADVGKACYIVDDQTVAKTDGTGTRSLAGIVIAVDSSGVFVEMSPALSQALASPA